MKILIPFLGKTRSAWIEAGIRDYAERLRRYVDLEMPVLRERHSPGAPPERTMLLQAEELLRCCAAAPLLVALDPSGRATSSEELAELLERWEGQGRGAAFCIGGHLGLHASLTARAAYRLSLSKMTFTHEMSRLILVEQLYRACAIRAGHPYHL